MSHTRGRADCPRCNRNVITKDGRYQQHTTEPKDATTPCRMSGQYAPTTGHTDNEYADRARLVADLAAQVQDSDPALVWEYLTCVDAAELQRLLVVALAGIDCNKRVHDIWGWVTELPVAKAVAA